MEDTHRRMRRRVSSIFALKDWHLIAIVWSYRSVAITVQIQSFSEFSLD